MKPLNRTIGIPAGCAALLALLCCESAACAEAMQRGLGLCLERVIPALFPFFAVSALCVSCGLAQAIGHVLAPLLRRVFHLPECGAAALVLGFLGGYPAGARTVSALHQDGFCSREEAEALLFCCNNTGPAFLIGMCGTGLFGSLRAGVFLYVVHIGAALLSAFLFRPKRVPPVREKAEPDALPPFIPALLRAVTDAGRSCLLVSAFVLFFCVIACLLRQTQLLPLAANALLPLAQSVGLSDSGISGVLTGCLELTQGLACLTADAGGTEARLAAVSFLCAFGGLSVLFQTAAVTEGLSFRRALLGKCAHAVLAAALCALLLWAGVPFGSFV